MDLSMAELDPILRREFEAVPVAQIPDEVKEEALRLADVAMDGIDLRAEIRNIAENDIDPAKGEHMFSRGIYAAARSIPYTAVAMVPGGMIINGLALQEQAYQHLGQVNPDMSRNQKMLISAIAAPMMAFTEKVGARVLMGKAPTLGRFLNQATVTGGSLFTRGAIRTAEGVVIEMVQENVQDVLPFVVQQAIAAIKKDFPYVPWDKVYGDDFWEKQGELFFAVLPLALVGGGAGSIRDFASARETIHNRDAVTLLVGDFAKADEIRKAADAGDYDTAQTLLRKGMQEAKTDSVPFVQARAAAGEALQAHAESQANAIRKAEQSGYIPEVVPVEGGFVVKGKFIPADATAEERAAAGEALQAAAREVVQAQANAQANASKPASKGTQFVSPVYKTREEANLKRWEHVEEQGLELHADMIESIDFLSRAYQPDRAIGIDSTGKRRTLLDSVNEGQRTREDALGRDVAADQIDDQGNPQGQATDTDLDIEAEYGEAFNEAERKALDEDDRLASKIIIGESVTEFKEGVYRTNIKVNQGATWATIFEEKTEGDAATFIMKGKRDWLANKLFAYDAEFQKGRLVGGKKLSIFKEGVTMETATDEDLKEAYSRAAIYYLTGSMRKGQEAGFKPSQGFRSRYAQAIRAGMSPIFDPMARFFRAIALRAARLNKMRREGRLDQELERELARSVGFSEQFEYEQKAIEEGQKFKQEIDPDGVLNETAAEFTPVRVFRGVQTVEVTEEKLGVRNPGIGKDGVNDFGYFWTPDFEYADSYRTQGKSQKSISRDPGRVDEATLDGNLFDAGKARSGQELLIALEEAGVETGLDVWNTPQYGKENASQLIDRDGKSIKDALINAGFDGLIFADEDITPGAKNANPLAYVVWDSSQINLKPSQTAGQGETSFSVMQSDPESLLPVMNRAEAERLFADGYSVYSFDELEEGIIRIESLDMMSGYTEFSYDPNRSPGGETSFSVVNTGGGRSVVIGARPGEYGWTPGGIAKTEKEKQGLESELATLTADPAANADRIREIEDELRGIASKTLPGPVTHPTQKRPRLERVGAAAGKILKSGKAKKLLSDLYGVTGLEVNPITGTWLGNREPSYVIHGESLTDKQAAEVGALFGFAWAQDATVVSRPNPNLTEGIPAYYLGSRKRLSEAQINAIHDAARERGLDFSTTPDGKAIQFLFFGDETDLAAFESSISEIQQASGLTEAYSELVSSDLNETETNFSRPTGRGQGQAWLHGTAEGLALFERVVSDLVAPYAKAIGAEGYRFNIDLYAKRFGLSETQKEIVTRELYPAHGRLKSSVPIMDGSIDLGVEGVTKKNGRFVSSVTNVVWSLQNWSAQFGLIAPGDYSKRAGKLIAQTITDEVAWHVKRAKELGKRSAIGWYDRALKAAKRIYARMFSELDVNGVGYSADMAMVFDAMLGIASQGNNVTDNSVMNTRVYANWRRDKIDTAGNINVTQGMTITQAVAPVAGTFGSKTVAIENNYLKLETLLANNSYADLRKFFNKTDTVGNINAYLRKNKKLWFNGEPLSVDGAAAQKVTGWMVFGPKIGSFINNLHGDYTTLTADLWFSRTWNRILGWSFIHSPEREAQNFISLRDAMVAEYTNDQSVRKMEKGKPVYWDHGTDVAKLGLNPAQFDDFINDPQQMLEFAERIEVIFRTGAREGAKKTTSYKDKSAVRRAAKTWVENRENVMEAPRSDHERMFQQDVMEKAQKMLKKMGIDINIADMQAALWYNEKDLYATLGSTTKLSAPADYEDAAKTTFKRIQEGTLYERIGSKEGEVDERIQPREWESEIFAGLDLKGDVETSFSVITNAESRIAESFNPFLRNPEKRLKIVLEAQRRAAEKARGFQEIIREARTVAQLDREQAAREGVEFGKLLEETFGADTEALRAVLPAVDRDAARSEAKSRAAKWRKEQDRGQKGIDRATLIAAMRTLDAMISALPSEIRGKIGGMVRLAQFKGPGAMLDELERRSKKFDEVLERWLKDEFRKDLAKIFKKAEAEKKSGKSAVGKLGALGHAWFDYASEVAEMHPVKLEAEIAGLEKMMTKPDGLSVEDINSVSAWVGEPVESEQVAIDYLEEKLNIATTMGGVLWGNITGGAAENRNTLTSEDMSLAADLAKEVYTGERLKRLAFVAERRERRLDLMGRMVERIGGAANDPARIRQRDKDNNELARMLENAFDEALDFSSRVEDILGEGPEMREILGAARAAENAEKDAIRARQIEFNEFLRSLFPNVSTAKRLAALEKIAIPREVPNISIKGVPAFMSELQAAHYTMLWKDDASKEWLESHGYDQGVIDGLENFMSEPAIKVREWLHEKYEAQYFRINEVYRRIKGVNLPRVAVYAPRMVEHMNQRIEGDLTTAAGMAGHMSTGFTKRRVQTPRGEPKPLDALAGYWSNAFMVEHYIAQAEFIGDLRATLGSKDVRMAIDANRGPRLSAQLTQVITAIDEGGVKSAMSNSMGAKFLRRSAEATARGSLAYNIGTILKQVPAAFASIAEIGPAQFWKSLGRINSGKAAVSPKVLRSSATIERRKTDTDLEMSVALKGGTRPILSLPGEAHFKAVAAMNWGMDQLGNADASLTSLSAAIAYDAHYRAAIEAGLDEGSARKIASERMEETIARTAQPDSVTTKSLFELQLGDVGRLLFMFQGPNRQAFGITYLAAKQVQKGGSKAKLANVLFLYWFVVPTIMQTIGNLMQMATSDDDSEEIWEIGDYLRSWALGPLTGALWVGPSLEAGVSLFGGFEKRLGESPITSAGEMLKRLYALANDDDIELKDITRTVSLIAKTVGGDSAAAAILARLTNQAYGTIERVAGD